MDGSPSLYSPTPDECAELKQKLKTELDEKVRKKEKEIEEMLKKIEKK